MEMKRFPAGARVCFIGDSITHGNNYCTRVIAYYKKHFPDDHVIFRNAGVSGGGYYTAEPFFEKDVLPFAPTHVTIMLGINDSSRDSLRNPDKETRERQLNAAFERYCTAANRFLDMLRDRGIEAILCTPSPYAEFAEGGEILPGGHALILRYAEFVRKTARRRGLGLVDFHARLSELYLDETLYGPDRVHPNDFGHYRMAECMLLAQGLEPDPYEPIDKVSADAGLDEWRKYVAEMRDIYAAESMIVGKYEAPDEEKMRIARDYVDKKKWGDFGYFEYLSKNYLEFKPQENEIAAKIAGIEKTM